MDFSGFGSLGGMSNGGIFGALQRQFNPAPTAAPAIPADGQMQPTIGPGTAPPAAAPVPYQPKFGLPKGGILGLLQGQSPQGLMGILNNMRGPQAAGTPLAGAMPQAGMMGGLLPGMPGAAAEGPVAPAPQLPTNINPMDQF